MTRTAAAVLITEGPRVLAFQRYDVAGLSLPCGVLEPDEPAAKAAAREAAEETGFAVIIDEANPFVGFDTAGNTLVTTYRAKIVGGALRQEAPGEGQPVWASVREVAHGPYWHYNQRMLRHFGIPVPAVGKFHSHLTIQAHSQAEAARAAKLSSGKLTVIDLQRDGRTQTDYMITHHYLTDVRGLEDQNDIVALLKSRALLLAETGIKVLRLKLEYDVTSTRNSPHDAEPACLGGIYTEVHVKCVVDEDRRSSLLESARAADWHPSRNPFAKREDARLVQFVNRRFYGATPLAEIDAAVDAIVPHIAELADIEEIKFETTVYDDNDIHDKWWMEEKKS